MLAQTLNDEELDLQARIGLLGTPQEQEDAILLLFDRFRRPLMSFLADLFADLDPDERASAVHDSFRTVLKMSTDGELDPDKPLTGLLFTVAKRRAIDARRKNSRRIRAERALAEEVGGYLAGTETGRDWKLVVTLEKAAQVGDELRRFVGTLKGRQRRVASVMADFLTDWLTNQEIAQEVFDRTGERMTTMEVKGAKNALMAKFREILKHELF